MLPPAGFVRARRLWACSASRGAASARRRRGAAEGTRFLVLGPWYALSTSRAEYSCGMALHEEGGSQLGLQLECPLQVAADKLALLARQLALLEQRVQRAVEVAVSRVQRLHSSSTAVAQQ